MWQFLLADVDIRLRRSSARGPPLSRRRSQLRLRQICAPSVLVTMEKKKTKKKMFEDELTKRRKKEKRRKEKR